MQSVKLSRFQSQQVLVQLTADVAMIVDCFNEGPASRKIRHLQDMHTLLASPIRGPTKGIQFWETFSRTWTSTRADASLSRFLGLCLNLRPDVPCDQDPIWFVADVDVPSENPEKAFQASDLLHALDGENLFHAYVFCNSFPCLRGSSAIRSPTSSE